MKPYQQQFIELALASGALCFGEFQIKSGRISPYFFNAGFFNTGKAIAQLGRFYAAAIVDSQIGFDMLFGPAYKGISLVTAVAFALAEHHNIDKPFAFNRKETKQYGEGGTVIGAPLRGRVLVIDDVISAGTTVDETIEIFTDRGCEMMGIVISIDRQERAQHGNLSAVEQIRKLYSTSVINIITLAHLISYLEEQGGHAEELAQIEAYRKIYGSNPKS